MSHFHNNHNLDNYMLREIRPRLAADQDKDEAQLRREEEMRQIAARSHLFRRTTSTAPEGYVPGSQITRAGTEISRVPSLSRFTSTQSKAPSDEKVQVQEHALTQFPVQATVQPAIQPPIQVPAQAPVQSPGHVPLQGQIQMPVQRHHQIPVQNSQAFYQRGVPAPCNHSRVPVNMYGQPVYQNSYSFWDDMNCCRPMQPYGNRNINSGW